MRYACTPRQRRRCQKKVWTTSTRGRPPPPRPRRLCRPRGVAGAIVVVAARMGSSNALPPGGVGTVELQPLLDGHPPHVLDPPYGPVVVLGGDVAAEPPPAELLGHHQGRARAGEGIDNQPA